MRACHIGWDSGLDWSALALAPRQTDKARQGQQTQCHWCQVKLLYGAVGGEAQVGNFWRTIQVS